MISNQFQSLLKKYGTSSRIYDTRFAIYEGLGGAGIKGMPMPQSACCAGKQRRSATLSTILAGTGVRPPPPAFRRQRNPRNVLGIKVRWALLGFVGPFIFKKYLKAATTNI
jgi:hypothetical protein